MARTNVPVRTTSLDFPLNASRYEVTFDSASGVKYKNDGGTLVVIRNRGIRARGTLTLAVQPVANDTMTIGSVVYTFKASGAIAGQINLGSDVAGTRLNVVAAVNGVDDINAINPDASAATFSGSNCILSAAEPGAEGNSVATTETFTSGSNVFDAATLGTTTAGAASGGDHVVTVTGAGTYHGRDLPDKVVTILANDYAILGPYLRDVFNQPSGADKDYVYIDGDGTQAELTAFAFRGFS